MSSIDHGVFPFANRARLRDNGPRRAPRLQAATRHPAGFMSTDTNPDSSEQAFLRVAAACGLDTTDTERMGDLRSRVALMRQGLARLYEIDVAGSESPSVFVPERRPT